MSLFDLISHNDEEIELVTIALSRWLKTNHVDPDSERGKAALRKAILLVRSGVTLPDDIVAGLGEVSAPHAGHPASANGEPRANQ